MKIEKGKRYKTRGGWLAECIFDGVDHSYCIHFVPGGILEKKSFRIPGDDVSCPIWHGYDGEAGCIMGVHEPPTYYGHPADIVSLVSSPK